MLLNLASLSPAQLGWGAETQLWLRASPTPVPGVVTTPCGGSAGLPAHARLQREVQTQALGPAGRGPQPASCVLPFSRLVDRQGGPQERPPGEQHAQWGHPACHSTGCIRIHPENGVRKRVLPRRPRAKPVERAGAQLQRGRWPLRCSRVVVAPEAPSPAKAGSRRARCHTPHRPQVRALGCGPDGHFCREAHASARPPGPFTSSCSGREVGGAGTAQVPGEP